MQYKAKAWIEDNVVKCATSTPICENCKARELHNCQDVTIFNNDNLSFDYENGYFKALLDLLNYIDDRSENLKFIRNKKFALMKSLIKFLLENRTQRELFIKYGGDVATKYKDDKECTIIDIYDNYKGDV